MIYRLTFLLFAIGILFIKVANGQRSGTGIYLTADDYLNNTPLKCVKVTLRKSSITAHFDDGTKKKFEAGTFWGYIGPRYKRAELSTSYRYYNGTYYGIAATGALWSYEDGKSGWDLSETGETVFVSMPWKYMITEGINGTPIELKYNDNLTETAYSMMDRYYLPQVKAFGRRPIHQIVQYYNNLKAGTPDKGVMTVVVLIMR